MTPVRLGAATVLVLAALVAGFGLLGGTGPEPSSVAAAATSVPTGSAAPASLDSATSGDPTEPAAATPTARPSDRPTPEPTATPRPPKPTPSATTAPEPSVDGGTTATAHAHALQRRLDAWREKHFVPGVSVAMLWDDGRVWRGVSGNARRRGRAAGHARHGLRPRLDLQDADGGRRPAARRRGQAAARRARRAPAARRSASTAGSRSGCSWTTRATSTTSSSTRRIDHALQSRPDATWTAKRTWRYVPPGRIRPGKVWSYSNTNYLLLGELVKAVTGRPARQGGPRPAAGPARPANGLVPGRREAQDRAHDGLPAASRWRAAGHARCRSRPASDVMPFRSVVTAAGGAGSIAATARGRRALDAGLRRRQGPVTGDADRDARRRQLHPRRSTRASRTASGSRS